MTDKENVSRPFLTWSKKDEVLEVFVYFPSYAEAEHLHNKEVQLALERAIGAPVIFGYEAFISLWEESAESYPFYLWPLAKKIYCNRPSFFINTIYEYGVFQLDRYLDPYDPSTLSELPVKLPVANHKQDENAETFKKSAGKSLWCNLFTLLQSFSKTHIYDIYWIEDQSDVLRNFGFKVIGGEDGNINVWSIEKDGEEIIAKPKVKPGTLDYVLPQLERIINNQNKFYIFIVDMYFVFTKSQNNSQEVSLHGHEIIKRIREHEKSEMQQNALQNLIIVFTQGTSPYIFSRSKALGADLVVFKSPARGHQVLGEIDPQFLLLWSIFWPISIIRYICNKLHELKELANNRQAGDKKGDFQEKLEKLDGELGKLHPERVFYFWQDWFVEAKCTVKKGIQVLDCGKMDERKFAHEIEGVLKKAFFKIRIGDITPGFK